MSCTWDATLKKNRAHGILDRLLTTKQTPLYVTFILHFPTSVYRSPFQKNIFVAVIRLKTPSVEIGPHCDNTFITIDKQLHSVIFRHRRNEYTGKSVANESQPLLGNI